MDYHNNLLIAVNKKIDEVWLDFEKEPENLYNPIIYVLKSGGKRIRPILTLMACDFFGGNQNDAIEAAVGIEVFHNFTLLHDDMMDNADMRRGMPVVHKKWNDNIALLSGDAMSILAYQLISKTKVRTNEVLNVFSKTALQICEGQQYDMDFENREDVSEKEYLKMIELKTAVLLACSLKIGAIIADANKDDCQLIYEFGKNLGIAFQLQDDYLDVYGDSDKFGKNIGGDIVSNKKTFLLVKAIKEAKDDDEKVLKYWLNKKQFDRNEKINAVKNIYQKLSVKEYSQKIMNDYYNKAFRIFDEIKQDESLKNRIVKYVEILSKREF